MSRKLILGILGVAAIAWLLSGDDEASLPTGLMPGSPQPLLTGPPALPIGMQPFVYPAPVLPPNFVPGYRNPAIGVIIGGDRKTPVISTGDGNVWSPGDFGG